MKSHYNEIIPWEVDSLMIIIYEFDPVSTDYLVYVSMQDMTCEFFSTKNVKNLCLHDTPTPKMITKAYLLGSLHDSTKTKYTYRICQKSFAYIKFIAAGVKNLGAKSWVYKEGKDRHLYIAEFSKRLLNKICITSDVDKIDYIRGYFDTEGGIPRDRQARYYIYFAQKNHDDLKTLRSYLIDLGFDCGEIHNPSVKVDPLYFRFYVLHKCLDKFGTVIGSFHPEKRKCLRMKI